MNTFPSLSSAAVTQYPVVAQYARAVQTLWFLDGSQQRYLLQPVTLRMWRINLMLLNENEAYQIESFFEAQQGSFASFVFPDPFTGSNVPNCRFASSELLTEYVDVDNVSTSFWVIETNG